MREVREVREELQSSPAAQKCKSTLIKILWKGTERVKVFKPCMRRIRNAVSISTRESVEASEEIRVFSTFVQVVFIATHAGIDSDAHVQRIPPLLSCTRVLHTTP